MPSYQPGVCNIGSRGRTVRIAVGLVFFVAAFYVWISFKASGYAPMLQVAAAFPFYVSFLGIYQGIFSFCVFHAREGTFSVGSAVGHVLSPHHRKEDRKKSIEIQFFSALSAVLVTGILITF